MSAGRVLLTGASGLIGRQTVAPLQAAGFEVIALSRAGRDIAGASGLAMDLLDPAAATAIEQLGASHLVHLAWHDGPKDRWVSPSNLDWTAATLRLARAFAKGGGTRMVGVGSCAEYDWSVPVLAESTPLRPATLYGAAKASTGTLLMAGADALGLSLAWGRVFFCYGPGEPKGRLLGDLIKGLRAGDTVDCTDGLQERDFLHTADIGAALAALLSSAVTGPVNIASGKATPVRDVIETTARLIGAPERVNLGARPRPADDPARLVADVARLRDAVGFAPRLDLEAGLKDTLAQEAA